MKAIKYQGRLWIPATKSHTVEEPVLNVDRLQAEDKQSNRVIQDLKDHIDLIKEDWERMHDASEEYLKIIKEQKGTLEAQSEQIAKLQAELDVFKANPTMKRLMKTIIEHNREIERLRKFIAEQAENYGFTHLIKEKDNAR